MRWILEYLYASEARKFAYAGMTFLANQEVPGEMRVEPRKIAIGTQHDCILGQLHGSYRVGLRHFGITDDAHAAAYGFRVMPSFLSRTIGNERALEILSDVWRQILPENGRIGGLRTT